MWPLPNPTKMSLASWVPHHVVERDGYLNQFVGVSIQLIQSVSLSNTSNTYTLSCRSGEPLIVKSSVPGVLCWVVWVQMHRVWRL